MRFVLEIDGNRMVAIASFCLATQWARRAATMVLIFIPEYSSHINKGVKSQNQ